MYGNQNIINLPLIVPWGQHEQWLRPKANPIRSTSVQKRNYHYVPSATFRSEDLVHLFLYFSITSILLAKNTNLLLQHILIVIEERTLLSLVVITFHAHVLLSVFSVFMWTTSGWFCLFERKVNDLTSWSQPCCKSGLPLFIVYP